MKENKIIVDKETLEFKRYSNDFYEATETELFMDEPIWKVCKILTDKGYKLNYSCGGHINIGAYKSKAVIGVEISFCYDYGITPLY